jgi:Hydroxymethylglutaryl-coenzyme A reductase
VSPFFKTKSIKGTGLGLWICKGIIENYKGTIRFRSTKLAGRNVTYFSIFLPVPASEASLLVRWYAFLMMESRVQRARIPRDQQNDYTREAASQRRAFAEEQTGVHLEHVARYSFDPALLPGNIENFTGVAQVPLGLAGPLRMGVEVTALCHHPGSLEGAD